VLQIITGAANRRLALEEQQGAGLVAAASDRSTAAAIERRVRTAWIKWYEEALDSIERLPVEGPSEGLRRDVANAKRALGNQ
jgi:hypothetical protein